MKRLFSLLLVPVVAVALSLSVPSAFGKPGQEGEKKTEKKKKGGKKKKGEKKEEAGQGAKPQQKIGQAHITPSPAPGRWRPPSAPRFQFPLPIACAPPVSAGKTGRAVPVRKSPIRP